MWIRQKRGDLERETKRAMRDRKVTVILFYGPLGPEMSGRVNYNNKVKIMGLQWPFT